MNPRWSPGIGDPSLGGWFTVAAYFATALLCFRAYRKAARTPATSDLERWGWLGLSALMAFLCINKQLDLQSLFTQIGRDMAWAGGWYENRRAVQAVFVLGFALVGSGFGVLIMRFASTARNPWVRLAAFGTILITVFIIVRAASFHHFEMITDARLMGLRYNWIFENTPLLMIGIAAWKSTARTVPRS